MKRSIQDKTYYSIREAARILRVHVGTLHALERRGVIPRATRTAHGRVYSPIDLDRIRAARKKLHATANARRGRFATPLSLEELNACRADPAWEAHQQIADYVVCRECGAKIETTIAGKQGHLWKRHRLPPEQYRRKYPGVRLEGFGFAAGRPGRSKAPLRVALRQSSISELTEARANSNYERDRGVTEYVICRECGEKQRTLFGGTGHLGRRHRMALSEYRSKWPGAPWACRGKQKQVAERMAERLGIRASQRPTDWDDRAIDWRIVATELLLKNGYLSNKNLADRLDASKILKCPYADTWRAAAADENNRGFVLFIGRVRKWVNRPGRVQRS